jgi:hypothetical protein
MNYIKEAIITRHLKKDNISFALFQHDQPVKYMSIPRNTTVKDIHYEFAKVVVCDSGIRQVFIANDSNMTRVPFTSSTLPIHEFLTLNKHCLDISLHYLKGITINIYFIDNICIQDFINKNKGVNEIELMSIYTNITDDTRKMYVNDIVEKISS